MPIELKMPALSPTMEKGVLAKWLIAVGDVVKAGDMVAEIETDKATMEYEAVDEGRVVELSVAEGTDDVPVGTVIALLLEPGESVAQPASIGEIAVPSAFRPEPATSVVEPPIPSTSPLTVFPPVQAISIGSEANATPLAKRIAAANGISLEGISGTGARGRIVKADLGLKTRAAPPQPELMPLPLASVASNIPPPAGVPADVVKLSTMRKTIARRLTESKQTVPHFYLTARCNLDALLKLRGELNAGLANRGIKLSVNDMLIKALTLTLIEVPDANVQFGGDEMYRFGRVDISMAVAIDGGLITPVIKDAGSLSLSAIAQRTQSLAAKAREGKLMPEDYQGGTASISNLGMFGIDEMSPVINPPQALILGIGSGVEQPWKVDDMIALATIMSATASFDHRVIDGAAGARFMSAFRDFVENPVQLMC